LSQLAVLTLDLGEQGARSPDDRTTAIRCGGWQAALRPHPHRSLNTPARRGGVQRPCAASLLRLILSSAVPKRQLAPDWKLPSPGARMLNFPFLLLYRHTHTPPPSSISRPDDQTSHGILGPHRPVWRQSSRAQWCFRALGADDLARPIPTQRSREILSDNFLVNTRPSARARPDPRVQHAPRRWASPPKPPEKKTKKKKKKKLNLLSPKLTSRRTTAT